MSDDMKRVRRDVDMIGWQLVVVVFLLALHACQNNTIIALLQSGAAR